MVPAVCSKYTDAEIDSMLREKARHGMISNNTLATYLAAVKRVKMIMRDKPTCEILMRPAVTMAAVETTLGCRKTLEGTVAALMGVMKHVGLRDKSPDTIPTVKGETRRREFMMWRTKYKQLEDEMALQRGSGEPTERQAAGRLYWKDVQRKHVELKRKSYGTQEYLLSSLYAEMPPRRQGDYYRVYIMVDSKDERRAKSEPAHIDMTVPNPRIYVREHKTAKSYGTWEVELPTGVVDALQASLKNESRDYMFTQTNGMPYSSVNSFTQYHNRKLKEWFGNSVSNNSLRHAYATLVNNTTMSANERGAIAKAMGHGTVMNMTYAFKPNAEGDSPFTRVINGKVVTYP